MRKFLEKTPWGVVSWIFGILVFYLTLGVWGAQFVFAQINGQTGQIATIFDSWWQVLIFIADIICAVAFAGALTMYIRKKLLKKEEKKVEELDA